MAQEKKSKQIMNISQNMMKRKKKPDRFKKLSEPQPEYK